MQQVHLGLAGFSHPQLQHLYGDQSRSQWLDAYARIFGAYELACARHPQFDRATAKRLVAQAPPGLRLLSAAPALGVPANNQAIHAWHHAVEPILRSPNAGPVHVTWPGPYTPGQLDALQQTLSRLWARLPWSARIAIEFLHPSWFRSQTMRALEEHGAALVWSKAAGLVPRRVTADFLYLRLIGARGEVEELARALAARTDNRPIHVVSTRFHEPYGVAALDRFAGLINRPLDLSAGSREPISQLHHRHEAQTTLDGYVGAVA